MSTIRRISGNLTIQSIDTSGNITFNTNTAFINSNVSIGNSLTVANGTVSTGKFTGAYTDGIILDYIATNGRISVGTADSLTFYSGGLANTPILTLSSTF